VDTAVPQGFGRRLAVAGPIEMAEMQDGWAAIQEIAREILPHLDASRQPSPFLEDKVARGEVGPSSGRGFYEWTSDEVRAREARLRSALAGFPRVDRSRGEES
jgi:3-hydroxybutyryl-CoA dehydrogenase